MRTEFLLMAQYDGRAVIPADIVCRDFFPHLTVDKFIRKVHAGDIALPLVHIEDSQKCAKGVHLQDLAAYIDKRRELAHREMRALTAPIRPRSKG